MVAWRDQNGKVILMSDLCPHIGASLCQGKLVENRLACPFHGFEYDSSGQCKYVPALGKTGAVPKSLKVRTYHTCEAHGIIWLWWASWLPSTASSTAFGKSPSITCSGELLAICSISMRPLTSSSRSVGGKATPAAR